MHSFRKAASIGAGIFWAGNGTLCGRLCRVLDLDMCCILIWIGNINPVATLTCGNESQINMKERGPGNEGNLLGTLVDLLISKSEGNSA